MIHWHNLKYILRHKWLVFVECCKLGIPWLGIIHDWSKFLPDEWQAYARFFYDGNSPVSERGGISPYARPVSPGVRNDIDFAVLKHLHRNKHHWQHWLLINDTVGDYPLMMPERYIREMVADWRGASAARGRDVRDWWLAHGDEVRLHPFSRARFIELLGVENA